jgi:hypothetical protein
VGSGVRWRSDTPKIELVTPVALIKVINSSLFPFGNERLVIYVTMMT